MAPTPKRNLSTQPVKPKPKMNTGAPAAKARAAVSKLVPGARKATPTRSAGIVGGANTAPVKSRLANMDSSSGAANRSAASMRGRRGG